MRGAVSPTEIRIFVPPVSILRTIARPVLRFSNFDGASTPYPPPQNPKWCSLFNIYKSLQGKKCPKFKRFLTESSRRLKNVNVKILSFKIRLMLIGGADNNRVF